VYKPGQFIRGRLDEVLAWRLFFFRSIIVLIQEASHYGSNRPAIAAWLVVIEYRLHIKRLLSVLGNI
jgi:hypothetical protein